METVDKNVGMEEVTEAKWCDHVTAYGQWISGRRPTICVISPRVHIIIEYGICKILCGSCWLKASQLPDLSQ